MKTTVCIAGPGSGKTRTLIQRVADVLNSGADPKGVACITYTNAAADEMRQRLRAGYFGAASVPLGHCGTLHSFLLKALRLHGESLGFGPAVQVISEQHAEAVLEGIMKAGSYKGTRKAVDEALEAGPDLGKGKVLTPAQVVAVSFFRTLKRQNMVSFDSLLHYGARLASSIRGYTHLFVDEAQDGSDMDFAIYKALPIESMFFVGDPDQAIYAFRGGKVDNLLWLANAAAPEDLLLLERNYRSDRRITAAADRLIAHNTNRVPKQTVSVTEREGIAVFKEHGHPSAEMQAVAAEIAASTDYDQCAVLVRTNVAVSMWREFLQSHGLPVKTRKTVERPDDWRLACALLAVFSDPMNDMAAHWALCLKVGPDRAATIKRDATASQTLLSTLIHPSPWRATLESIADFLGPLVSRGSLDIMRSVRDSMPPGALLQDMTLRIAEAEADSVEEGKGVTVCTMHAAKGREWASVWMPGLDQATIPGLRKSLDIEEERRLFYVGMTRAKHELRLSFAPAPVARWGSERPSSESQFIAEANFVTAPALSC